MKMGCLFHMWVCLKFRETIIRLGVKSCKYMVYTDHVSCHAAKVQRGTGNIYCMQAPKDQPDKGSH